MPFNLLKHRHFILPSTHLICQLRNEIAYALKNRKHTGQMSRVIALFGDTQNTHQRPLGVPGIHQHYSRGHNEKTKYPLYASQDNVSKMWTGPLEPSP